MSRGSLFLAKRCLQVFLILCLVFIYIEGVLLRLQP
jgi:hypothetical protein